MTLNDKTRKHNDMDFQKDLSEILTNAKIGLWAIEMDEGKEPRMYFDDVAREITGFYEDMTPEECYERWYKRIVDSAIDSVQASVKEMIEQANQRIPMHGFIRRRDVSTHDVAVLWMRIIRQEPVCGVSSGCHREYAGG